MRIDGIQPGNPLAQPGNPLKINPDNPVPSFKDTLATFLTDVNASQKTASDIQLKFLSGEVTDVHQVMSKAEEATVAFNLLMEIRNKAMDGYQEVMRMRL